MKNTKNNIKQFLHDAKAVSPAIATLILIVIAAVAAAGVGILVQSSQENAQDQTANKNMDVVGTIDVKGSSTILPITQAAAETFIKQYPAVDIKTAAGGSGAGRELVWTEQTDIGASSDIWPDAAKGDVPGRADAVIQAAGSADAKIWETQIGSGLIVIAANIPKQIAGAVTVQIVNDTMTEDLTATDGFVAIRYSTLKGAYTNPAAPITITTDAGPKVLIPVQRKDPGGSEEVFAKWIALAIPTGSPNAGQLNSGAHEENGNQGIRDYVAGTPYAFGFVDVGFAQGGVNGKDGAVASILLNNAGTNVTASQNTVGASGAYNLASEDINAAVSGGLARDLYYYSYGTPQGAVKAYLDFIVSLEGQKIVEQTGFFKLS